MYMINSVMACKKRTRSRHKVSTSNQPCIKCRRANTDQAFRGFLRAHGEVHQVATLQIIVQVEVYN